MPAATVFDRVRVCCYLIHACLFWGIFACRAELKPGESGTHTVDARVLALMECVECYDGERDAVIEMGAAALTSLREALMHGPSPDRLAQLERSLRTLRTPGRGALTEPAIAYQLRSYRNLYTRRAADALGGIGGSAAKAMLCAVDSAAAPPVGAGRKFVDSAIARIGGTCP